MKTSPLAIVLCSVLLAVLGTRSAHGDEPMTRDERLVQCPEAFPVLDLSPDAFGAPRVQTLTFNQTVVPGMKKRFSGFRFRVDRTAAAAAQGVEDKTKLGLFWFFVEPEGMDSWYIVPMKGEMDGFDGFYPIKQIAFQNRDTLLPAKKKCVIIQNLAAGSLVEGEEYLIWFACTEKAAVPTVISLAVGYRQDKRNFDYWLDLTGISRFLGLVPAAGQKIDSHLEYR